MGGKNRGGEKREGVKRLEVLFTSQLRVKVLSRKYLLTSKGFSNIVQILKIKFEF